MFIHGLYMWKTCKITKKYYKIRLKINQFLIYLASSILENKSTVQKNRHRYCKIRYLESSWFTGLFVFCMKKVKFISNDGLKIKEMDTHRCIDTDTPQNKLFNNHFI